MSAGEARRCTRCYGDRAAVLMGDFLFARCFALVSEYARPENASILSVTVGHLIEAEISEFTTTEDDWSVRRYVRRVIGKTAVLFALAFHIGAAEAGDNPDARRIEILRRIGYNVGIGFQIIDDVSDLFGDRKTTGKPVGGDLRRGVRTLPIILAVNNGQRSRLVRSVERIAMRHTVRFGGGRALRFFENRAIRNVCNAIEDTGGRHGALSTAEVYTRRAHRELDRLPATDDQQILRGVTTTLLSRSA